jgi:hypothetical protein
VFGRAILSKTICVRTAGFFIGRSFTSAARAALTIHAHVPTPTTGDRAGVRSIEGVGDACANRFKKILRAARRLRALRLRHATATPPTATPQLRYASATARDMKNSLHGPMHRWCGPRRGAKAQNRRRQSLKSARLKPKRYRGENDPAKLVGSPLSGLPPSRWWRKTLDRVSSPCAFFRTRRSQLVWSVLVRSAFPINPAPDERVAAVAQPAS